MTYARQFILPFTYDTSYQPDAFLAAKANADALAWIEHPEKWPARRLAVQGEAGVGKSHFLHLFAHHHEAALLPAEALRLFMKLPDAKSLAIDDADTVTDPRALLHVLNAAGERDMPVLMSGRSAPAYWGVALPDLASRLRAITVVNMAPPDDALLQGLLRRLLADRQLSVSERVQAYMLRHLPRTGGALREAVARLDRLAFSNGGQATTVIAAMAVHGPAALEIDPPPLDSLSLRLPS